MGDELIGAVEFAELGFLNFSGGIAGNFGENDFFGTLIAGEFHAKIVDFIFGKRKSFFNLNDCSGDFAQTQIGQTDNGDIFNGIVPTEEIFNLNGI